MNSRRVGKSMITHHPNVLSQVRARVAYRGIIEAGGYCSLAGVSFKDSSTLTRPLGSESTLSKVSDEIRQQVYQEPHPSSPIDRSLHCHCTTTAGAGVLSLAASPF